MYLPFSASSRSVPPPRSAPCDRSSTHHHTYFSKPARTQEVWGAGRNMLQQGMRPIAHDRLFRLLLTTREELQRAQDYAFRGWCRRRSREKLATLGNLLKSVLLNEMRVVSALLTVKEKLTDPKAFRLQPMDLLNSAHNQSYVDYENVANVCLRALSRVPLVRAALLSEFDTVPDGVADLAEEISAWPQRNVFCSPSASGPGSEPVYREDPERPGTGLPEVYKTTCEALEIELKDVDKRARVPMKRKALLAQLQKAYNSADDVPRVLRATLKCLASMQDLVPAMFACHEFWTLAGEGGDYTVYDVLRPHIVSAMGDMISRVYAVHAAEGELLAVLSEMAKTHDAAMERRRLATRKAEYEPAWVTNLAWVKTELVGYTSRGYVDVFRQCHEIARDAWNYTLSASHLNDKISHCRSTIEALCGGSVDTSIVAASEFRTSSFIDLKSRDWLCVGSSSSGPGPGSGGADAGAGTGAGAASDGGGASGVTLDGRAPSNGASKASFAAELEELAEKQQSEWDAEERELLRGFELSTGLADGEDSMGNPFGPASPSNPFA